MGYGKLTMVENKMRAAWYEKVGDAKDVLQVGQIDDPTPDSNEVLISVKTSGINPSDVKIRAVLEATSIFKSNTSL